MLEVVVEVLGELILQGVLEVLVESGLRSSKKPLHTKPRPLVAAFGYVVIGAAVGGLSLLVFPYSLVAAPLRLANLLITPILVGAMMMAIGAWRAKRGQHLVLMDKFFYGFLFALSLGVVRYFFAV